MPVHQINNKPPKRSDHRWDAQKYKIATGRQDGQSMSHWSVQKANNEYKVYGKQALEQKPVRSECKPQMLERTFERSTQESRNLKNSPWTSKYADSESIFNFFFHRSRPREKNSSLNFGWISQFFSDNNDFSHDFHRKNTILRPDLKSASKISLTIREDFVIQLFSKKNFFLKIPLKFSGSDFLKKIFFCQHFCFRKTLADG